MNWVGQKCPSCTAPLPEISGSEIVCPYCRSRLKASDWQERPEAWETPPAQTPFSEDTAYMQEDIPETMRFSDMEGPSPEQVRAENREIRKELNAKITRHRLLIGAIWIVCLIYYGELGASSAPIFLAIGLSVFLTRKNRRVREELEALVDPIGVDEVLWPDRPLEPETEHLEDVVRWLEELGFTRIVRLPVRDILTPLSSKSGQVISVTIGGRAPKRGRVFKREDQVTISYHESKLKRFLRS